MPKNQSHDQVLSPDVEVRWWGRSSHLDIYWRQLAREDKVHPRGTPLVRVTGQVTREEAVVLRDFLNFVLNEEQ
jgi:hypothetical protein